MKPLCFREARLKLTIVDGILLWKLRVSISLVDKTLHKSLKLKLNAWLYKRMYIYVSFECQTASKLFDVKLTQILLLHYYYKLKKKYRVYLHNLTTCVLYSLYSITTGTSHFSKTQQIHRTFVPIKLLLFISRSTKCLAQIITRLHPPCPF